MIEDMDDRVELEVLKEHVIPILIEERNRLIWALRLQLGLEPISRLVEFYRASLAQLRAEVKQKYPDPTDKERMQEYRHDPKVKEIRQTNRTLVVLGNHLQDQLRGIFPRGKVPPVDENRASLLQTNFKLRQIEKRIMVLSQ